MKQLLATLILGFSIAACGGNADVDKFMKLDTEKAEVFKTGGADCVAKAKAVGDWRKAHTAEYNEMRKKLNDKLGKEPPKEIMEKYGTQIKENKKAVMDAMFACSSDPAFSKMMDDTKTE